MSTLTEQLNKCAAYIDSCAKADMRKGFCIGDRVRYRSMIGTIDAIVLDGGANMYSVRFDQGGRWAYRSVELKASK